MRAINTIKIKYKGENTVRINKAKTKSNIRLIKFPFRTGNEPLNLDRLNMKNIVDFIAHLSSCDYMKLENHSVRKNNHGDDVDRKVYFNINKTHMMECESTDKTEYYHGPDTVTTFHHKDMPTISIEWHADQCDDLLYYGGKVVMKLDTVNEKYEVYDKDLLIVIYDYLIGLESAHLS